MDTELPAAKKLPAIRTYAKDLELKRKEKGLPAEVATPTVTKPMPHAAAAKEVQTKVKRVSLFKRAPQEPAEQGSVTPLPPLSSIPKRKTGAPVPKIVATSTAHTTSFIVDNEDAASATIITDTKRDRFKLFPAIIASIKSWFSDKKKSYAAKKVPKYTVPETTRRKGVIQKATSKTGKFTSSDFESIQERIRLRKEAEEKPESKTIWTANTEPGVPLLEGEVEIPQIANVAVVARKSFRTAAPEKPAAPAPVTVSVVKRTPPPETSAPVPAPAPEALVEPDTAPEEVEETIPTVEEIPKEKSSFSLLQIHTNLLALGISGLIIAVVATAFYGYFMIESAPAQQTTPVTQTAHFPSSSFSAVALPEVTGQSITDNLESVRVANTDFAEVIFISSMTNEPIPAYTLFSGIKLAIPRDFAQAVASVHFGFVNGNPYLYLGIKDEVAARGGLLAWENDLYNSFRAIFADMLMPDTAAPQFIDATLSGQDVRVLKHNNGQELLLYTLVEGGAIITTGSVPLATLLNQQP